MSHTRVFKIPLLCLLLGVLTLQACSSDDEENDAFALECPEGYEQFAEFNLYFGREKGDGSEVSEQEWQDFLADEVTPRFPDGLTVLDGRGQWLDSDEDRLYREGTKVLNVLVPIEATSESQAALDEISNIYVERFDQQVVFKTAAPACAGF